MDQRSHPITRGAFLRRACGLFGVVALGPSDPVGHDCDADPLEHPEPRPDVTAERVLSVETLGSRKEKVLAAYEAARAYPAVFDGLACACGCTGKNGPHRSLLVCFETLQPTGCWGCQEEAQLVAKLAKEETSLAEIRKAVDKKYG